jgi:hypothetical protein
MKTFRALAQPAPGAYAPARMDDELAWIASVTGADAARRADRGGRAVAAVDFQYVGGDLKRMVAMHAPPIKAGQRATIATRLLHRSVVVASLRRSASFC